ncbi:MAG: hypothetical protein AAGC78_21115 [Cellvibrio sp.]|uniref:hypothetical protein n=1 Tax=Cellvibrio sp. TaxID=1965322 RepID=UPI0031A85BF8
MKLIQTLTALTLSALIAGCSSTSYLELETENLSRVRFATNETDVVVVRAYESAECNGESEWMRLRKGELTNNSPKSLGIPLQTYHKNAFKEFNVPAEKENIIMFVGATQMGSQVYSCAVPLNLNFLEKGKDYEFFYQKGFNACTVTVSEIQSSSSGEATKNVLKLYQNDPEGFGKSCMALFKKQKLF